MGVELRRWIAVQRRISPSGRAPACVRRTLRPPFGRLSGAQTPASGGIALGPLGQTAPAPSRPGFYMRPTALLEGWADAARWLQGAGIGQRADTAAVRLVGDVCTRGDTRGACLCQRLWREAANWGDDVRASAPASSRRELIPSVRMGSRAWLLRWPTCLPSSGGVGLSSAQVTRAQLLVSARHPTLIHLRGTSAGPASVPRDAGRASLLKALALLLKNPQKDFALDHLGPSRHRSSPPAALCLIGVG